ncbi:DUF4331 domain-containing protein [Streptosporangium sp. NPDC051023]|uniref:DUF4331 domain-containing protein n=1 Tax=Streptosporangium sp. NPDC051023 TaxID=3155410 RepID=UPI00344B48CE
MSILVVGVSGTIAAGGLLLGPATGPVGATSHWDAPATTADPQIDAADLYAFTSPERQDTVTLVVDYVPFQPQNTLNPFATDTRYELHIDHTGTGKPDITYRWTFRNEDRRPPLSPLTAKGVVRSAHDDSLLFRQRYTLEKLLPGRPDQTLVRDAIAAPSHLGSLVMPDYQRLRDEAVVELPGGGRAFAGQAADPFYGDREAIGLLRFGAPSPPVATGAPLNVNTMAIQVPKSELALGGAPGANPVVGVWATASRRSLDLRSPGETPYVQVSRLGNPDFNEVFVPLSSRDRFNGTSPRQDRETAGVVSGLLAPERAGQVQLATGAQAPKGPRKDLEELYLTGLTTRADGPIGKDLNSQLLNRDVAKDDFVPAEELRLNMGTPVTAAPHRYGYLRDDPQGFPNGRRPTDDVVAIGLRTLMGEPAGAGSPWLADENGAVLLTKPVTGTFPYLAIPNYF